MTYGVYTGILFITAFMLIYTAIELMGNIAYQHKVAIVFILMFAVPTIMIVAGSCAKIIIKNNQAYKRALR